MWGEILKFDKLLFLTLNNWGSENWDTLWLMITRQINWLPLFILLAYIIFKNLGTRQSLILMIFVAVLIAFTDQGTNLFKNHFHRLRPVNNPDFLQKMRMVQHRNSFSFFSGHAATSMSVAVLLWWVLRKRIPFFGFIFLWPLVFAYSRIYLGLHYPSDIIAGYIFGFCTGSLMYLLYKWMQSKYFPAKDFKSETL